MGHTPSKEIVNANLCLKLDDVFTMTNMNRTFPRVQSFRINSFVKRYKRKNSFYLQFDSGITCVFRPLFVPNSHVILLPYAYI